jgi:hypothetical protein
MEDKMTVTTDLDDYSTKDLLDEIERRKTRKIIRMRQRKTWACRCGYKFTSQLEVGKKGSRK